ncbi:ORF65 [Leucania separata nucleopolyhedrovirus]|uniref:ORF65 n=1 Tax=Leucania separata nucleopolyhedrovirus TaxID=1307956 RepID=Q0IL54_NPVLS|nr:ORF65 [Leucania separata nucleopolyhedrovirus]AAR28829.1 ORF65 [Leucania separata nucleopolyhedrovirus]
MKMSSGVNFKLEKLIAGTIMNNYNDNKRYTEHFSSQRSGASFGSDHSAVSSSSVSSSSSLNNANHIGRVTTYDVLGQRNYQTFYDSNKFKF